jgi:hypothetical protein
VKGPHKLFAILVFVVLCIGLVPMTVRPLPYEGLDWLSYEAAIQYGDPYEPDNSKKDAKECLVDGQTQVHNFHVPGDIDWVWFHTQAGSFYAIQVWDRSLGSQANTTLALETSSDLRAEADQSGITPADSVLRFEAAYTGVYYVVLTELQDRYGSDYWYHLRISHYYRRYLPIILRGYSSQG